MKRLILLAGAFLLFGGTAFAGGGDFNDYQQQQVPQIKINIPPPTPSDDSSSWAVPVILGIFGLVGTLGTAYISVKYKKKD